MARQLLAAEPAQLTADGWLLDWLCNAADRLVNAAPQVAVALLEPALAAVGGPQRDQLASRLADALCPLHRSSEAERLATHTLAQATDPELLVNLLETLVRCRGGSSDVAEALKELDRATATPGLLPVHQARLDVLIARTRLVGSELDAADLIARQALAIATEVGGRWAMGWALNSLGVAHAWRAQTAEALESYERGLAATGDDLALTDVRLVLMHNRADVLAALDRSEEARQCLLEIRALADRTGNVARLLLAQRGLVERLFDAGQWDDALANCEIPDEGTPSSMHCTLHACAATIAFHRGDVATARQHLAAGSVHAQRLPRAQTMEAAGLLPAQRGATRAARTAFDQAFDGYTGLGAGWDLARLRGAFRPYGSRRGHGARRSRPTHGWDALTTTERKVAALIAEGLSNPRIAEHLVLSRRTVEAHVANILRKLDAGSRVEIALTARAQR